MCLHGGAVDQHLAGRTARARERMEEIDPNGPWQPNGLSGCRASLGAQRRGASTQRESAVRNRWNFYVRWPRPTQAILSWASKRLQMPPARETCTRRWSGLTFGSRFNTRQQIRQRDAETPARKFIAQADGDAPTCSRANFVIPPKFGDERGYFLETYNERDFRELGMVADFVQDNQSLSRLKGTVRGLHYQTPPHAQAKLVRVLRGSIFDVAVDLRCGSPTYGKACCVTLTASGAEQLFVPKGFAHGFCTLETDTEVAYKVDAYYAPECDHGILLERSGNSDPVAHRARDRDTVRQGPQAPPASKRDVSILVERLIRMPRRFLITGGAGFIGSAVVREIIRGTPHKVMVLDKLTYAGNLDNLEPVASDPRFGFVKADITDLSKSAFEKVHRSRLMSVVAAAMVMSASEVSGHCSKSRTRRRFLMSQANERSITQRRGSGSKPLRARGRFTTESATLAFARAQTSRRPA